MICEAPGCDREAKRAGKCDAHYMQARRAEEAGKRVRLQPLRTPPGEAGERIQLRPTREQRERYERAADEAGLTVQEWCFKILDRETG